MESFLAFLVMGLLVFLLLTVIEFAVSEANGWLLYRKPPIALNIIISILIVFFTATIYEENTKTESTIGAPAELPNYTCTCDHCKGEK